MVINLVIALVIAVSPYGKQRLGAINSNLQSVLSVGWQ